MFSISCVLIFSFKCINNLTMKNKNMHAPNFSFLYKHVLLYWKYFYFYKHETSGDAVNNIWLVLHQFDQDKYVNKNIYIYWRIHGVLYYCVDFDKLLRLRSESVVVHLRDAAKGCFYDFRKWDLWKVLTSLWQEE